MSLFVDYASIDANKPPALDEAKQFGVRGAYVRAGFTMAGLAYADPTCARDAAAWRKEGQFGAYMILGWHTPSPEDQVRNFIETYHPESGDLPPMLDLEADSALSIGRTPAQALEWAHRAYDALIEHYGTVMIYTSARVWSDVFGGLPSRMGSSPLMLKVPYPYKERQPPHPDVGNPTGPEFLPLPWNTPSSPGVWFKQFQGDAIGVPGFSSTVDLSVFCQYVPVLADKRHMAMDMILAAHGAECVTEFQRAKCLTADNIVGPKTFAALFGRQ